MIVIRVELVSAVNGKTQELGRMVISNEGGGLARRDYLARTYRGRDRDTLHKAMIRDLSGDHGGVQKRAEIKGWPSPKLHVWNLVARALAGMGYDKT